MIVCVIRPVANNPKILKSNTPDALALAREISSGDWLGGAVLLKEDDRTSVFSGECSLGPVVVKTMRVDRLKDSASKAIGITRLMRQWKGWERLVGAGVDSPDCFVLFREASVESLVMRRAAGETLFEYIARQDTGITERIHVARLVGEMLGTLNAAGLFNRDGKPSNLIVSPGRDRLWVIDSVGVMGSRRGHGMARMCANLIIEPTGLGNPVRTTDCMRVLRMLCGAADRGAFWHQVRDIIARKGFLAQLDGRVSGAHAREQ